MTTKSIFILLFFYILIAEKGSAQSLIINHHDVSAFDSIPENYKHAASNLRMLFMDRSVGGNISFYLDCLSNPWASAPSACKRYQHQDSLYAVNPSEVYWNGVWDRSRWRYEYWPANCSEDVNCFIDFMDDRLDSFDVMGCQFSYLAVTPGAHIADTVTGFFGTTGNDNKASTYAAFAAAHPEKKIIWWTTSLARGIGTPESASFNEQMRNYAASHDIILFDVADILSNDPEDHPCFDNRDGVTYKDESYPDDSLSIPAICPQYTTETDGGHLGSISAGGVRVSKAFWVLMARLAGWQGNITSTQENTTYFQLFPNPASGSVYLQFKSEGIPSSVKCFIFDLQGQIQFEQTVQVTTLDESHPIRIPLIHLPAGIYFIQIRRGEMQETQILIVH